MCNSAYANGTTLIESQPFVLLLVGITNVTFNGFSPDNLALGLNRDLSALRPQSGFKHWIFQQVVSLVVTVHGWTEAHVGQRKGGVVSIWSCVGIPPDILVACHGCNGRQGAVEMEVHNVGMGP